MAELKRIFYVEDEPDIMAVAQLVLREAGGFELCTASSGAEALEKIVDFNPDLIMLDVMMPGMDGPTTLREIHKLPGMADKLVCFMTAKVQPKEIEHYKALGAIDVIAKPFAPMGLCDRIKQIWNAYHEQ